MTFGNIASFLIALQPNYRNKVATHVSLPLSEDMKIPAKVLLSWCNALRYLRNICSHNGRLYDRLHNTLPAIHHADEELLEASSENGDKKLFVYFIAMRHTVMSMSKESKLFWNNKLQKLLEESCRYQVDLVHYGFSER
ncbi:Abi family protein [Streptococcus cuniculi]|uniref:Abi family protein n=2 Tax=Streptococcus cuniculi TaxID=1432788 RepID=A0A4Y9JBX4_9STRE|nr:Abi family protein [Streptococcus cuniculi]TFU98493.1 Abi family protein [Streptococcus cuniculi]